MPAIVLEPLQKQDSSSLNLALDTVDEHNYNMYDYMDKGEFVASPQMNLGKNSDTKC
jgi:hypothetical protein